MTRTQLAWWLGIAAGFIAYLKTQPMPTLWTYDQWLAFGFFAVTTLVAKFSPGLKGKE